MLGRIRILLPLLRGQRLRYAAAGAALLLSTVFLVLRPLIGRYAIDYVIAGKPLRAPGPVRRVIEWSGGRAALAENLWAVAVAVVAVTMLSGIFAYLKGRWSAHAAESVIRRLRSRLYDRLQHLPCRFFDRTPTGDLLQRCTSDVETIRLFLTAEIVDLGRAVVMLGIMLPVLFLLDVRMAFWSLALLPVIVLFACVFFAKIRSTFQRMDEAEGSMTTRLQENLAGVRVVRAFAQQEHERERFGRSNAEYRSRWRRLVLVMTWYWPTSELLVHAQRGLVLLVGGYFVVTTAGRPDEFTIGKLYAFLACVNMFMWPLQEMGRILADLGKALVSLGRVGGILAEPRESDPPAAAVHPQGQAAGRIEFSDVSFQHGDGQPVLDGLSFKVEPGQTMAVLGPSGSGKSTLINLLLRLYDYESGSIRLDGTELRALPRGYVRSQIGVVLQEPFLYSRSLRENIKLGQRHSGDQEMLEAASSASVHESIMAFDAGYDTLVGERGVTLSGGQRQRVALARALLKRPPVLILDDALSSVDTHTESLILRALRERAGRQTTRERRARRQATRG